MKLERGGLMEYQNNGSEPIPCIIIQVREARIADVAVFMPAGYSFRSSVPCIFPGEINPNPQGEFIYWNDKQQAREEKYPVNPDLWG